MTQASEILFIDSGVSDVATLLRHARPEVESVVLDRAMSPARRIAQVLAGRSGLAAIHLIAHGAPGRVTLGVHDWTRETVAEAAEDLGQIGRALRPDGDLRIWSCHAGAGPQGAAFVTAMARATGAKVAAADGLVGAESRGGTWELSVVAAADRLVGVEALGGTWELPAADRLVGAESLGGTRDLPGQLPASRSRHDTIAAHHPAEELPRAPWAGTAQAPLTRAGMREYAGVMAAYLWAPPVAGSTAWTTGGNWTVGGVQQSSPPGSGDDVTITSSANFAPTLNTTTTVLSLTINGSVQLTLSAANLTVTNGTTLSHAGATIAGTGKLTSSVAATTGASSIVATGGTLEINGGITDASGLLGLFVGSGAGDDLLIDGASAAFSAQFDSTNSGTLELNTGGVLTLASQMSVSGATVKLDGNGATLTDTGGLNNFDGVVTGIGTVAATISGAGAGTINANGGVLEITGAITDNLHEITLRAASSGSVLRLDAAGNTASAVSLASGGILALNGAASGLTVNSALSFSGGTIALAGGALTDGFGLTLGSGSTLIGSGTVAANFAAGAGTIKASGGVLTLYGAIASGNVLTIDPTAASELEVDSFATAAQAIAIGSAHQTLAVGANGYLRIDATESITNGTISLLGGALVGAFGVTIGSGAVLAGYGGVIAGDGGVTNVDAIRTGGGLYITGALTNSGGIYVTKGQLIETGDFFNHDGGSVTVGIGHTFSVSGGISNGVGGPAAIQLLDGYLGFQGGLTNSAAGTIIGYGTLAGDIAAGGGLIEASGGVLELTGSIGGGNVLAIDTAQASELRLDGTVTLPSAYAITNAEQTLAVGTGGYLTLGVAESVLQGELTVLDGGTLKDNSGITVGSLARLSNDGGIVSPGITVGGYGYLYNGPDGVIGNGSGVGVTGVGPGTVVNAGVISGIGFAVQLAAGYRERVQVDPGAVFNGVVDGGNTIGGSTYSTLVLGTGPGYSAGAGTLSGIGTQYINFSYIEIAGGAYWTLAGSATIASGVTLANDNRGYLYIGDSLTNDGTISGGITLTKGSYLYNTSGGYIGPGNFGAVVSGYNGGTVVNAGVIDPGGYGVSLSNGGTVTNLTGASIFGESGGVYLGYGGYLTNQSGAYIGGDVGVALYSDLSAPITAVNAGNIVGYGYTDDGHGAGIYLNGAIYVTNQAGGSISGYYGIFGSYRNDLSGTPTVVNYGVVAGNATYHFGAGVYMGLGGYVSNMSSGAVTGSITGYRGIVGGYSGPTTVVNAGVVTGNGTTFLGAGIFLDGGGYVTNQSSGMISGYTGVYGYNGATLVNNGGIAGNATAAYGVGVYLYGGASLTNQSQGSISGYVGMAGYAGSGHGAQNVVNDGAITGSNIGTRGAGVEIATAGYLTNQSDGTISGYIGVIGDGGTVTNAGYIDGVKVAVSFKSSYDDRLIIDPGATFHGVVDGGNAAGPVYSALELAPGTLGGVGTLSGVGSQYINFAQTTIDAKASWEFTGANSFAASYTLVNLGTMTVVDTTLTDAGALINDGTIVLDPSTMTVASLSGAGEVDIGTGGTLVAQGIVESGEVVAFTGGTGLLALEPSGFSGTIKNFVAGATVDLTGITDATTLSIVNANTLEIQRGGGGPIDLVLDPSGVYHSSDFNLGTDATPNHFDTVISNLICFAQGTRIDTPRGWVAVEDLRPGMDVFDAAGAIESVVWVGHRTVNCRAQPRPAAVWPVRVRTGAFGENVPMRDLYLSPDHAVFVNGVLVPVKLLIDGEAIARVERDEVTYWHVELPRHAVILAEGLTVESYLDTGDRANFASADGVVRLFPDFEARLAPSAAVIWETRGAAPLVQTGPALAEARRAVALGWSRRGVENDRAIAAEASLRARHAGPFRYSPDPARS